MLWIFFRHFRTDRRSTSDRPRRLCIERRQRRPWTAKNVPIICRGYDPIQIFLPARRNYGVFPEPVPNGARQIHLLRRRSTNRNPRFVLPRVRSARRQPRYQCRVFSFHPGTAQNTLPTAGSISAIIFRRGSFRCCLSSTRAATRAIQKDAGLRPCSPAPPL